MLEFPGGFVEEIAVEQQTVDVTAMGDAFERRMPVGAPIVTLRLRLKNPAVIDAVLLALGATRAEAKATADRYVLPPRGAREIAL